jgi:hypothetical protein
MGKSTEKRIPWLKLGLAAIATQGLYFSMAHLAGEANRTRSQIFEETLPYFALWAALWVLFAFALSAVRNRAGKGVTLFVFITSFAFRTTLIPGEGFHNETPTGWFVDPGVNPLMTVSKKLGFELPRESTVTVKVIAAGADLAALALMAGLLKTAGLSPALSAAHGWNPLAVKESAASGRLVTLGLLFLVITIRALQKSSKWKAAMSYGTSLMAGLWTAACAPMMIRSLTASASVAALMAVSGWAWVGLNSIDVMSVPYIGSSLLPATVGVAGVVLTRNPLYPTVFCFALWLALVLFRAFRRRLESRDFPREMLFALGGLLMVLPQVYPWYFIPLSFFSAFSGNRGWLIFTTTAPLTYLAYGNGEWNGWSFWLAFAQYFPAYFVLVFDWLGKKG